MVDMFPTLAALAGLPDPRTIAGSQGINGTSLLPALLDPPNATHLKRAAFSQFSKNNAPGDYPGAGTSVACTFFRNATRLMGYTIRAASAVRSYTQTCSIILEIVCVYSVTS